MNRKRWQAIAVCGLGLGLGVALAQEEARPAGEAPAARGVRQARGGREVGRERADVQRRGPFADLEAALDEPDQLKDMGLTPEQIETLKTGFGDIAQQRAVLQTAMDAAGTEQARHMTAEPLDEEEIMKAVEEAGRLRTEIAKWHAQQLILARKTLSNEQIEQIRQRRRQRMIERFRERRAEGEGENREGRVQRRGADAEAGRQAQAVREKMRERRQAQRPAPANPEGEKQNLDDLDKTW